MKTRVLLLGPALLFLLVSCASRTPGVLTENGGEAAFEISKATFIFEDIHPSFWKDASRRDSLFLSVFIYFAGETPGKDDIEEIRVYDESNRYWTVSLDKYLEENRSYIGGYTRFRTDEYSLNWSVMSLWPYRIQLHTKDGKILTYRYDPADPEPEGENTRNFLYSSDYTGRRDNSYIQNLRRAVIKEARLEEEALELTFGVDDVRAENGEVAFYTEDKEYVGETAGFKNIYSLEIRGFLNEGGAFYTDGRDNHLRITEEDIEFQQGRSYTEIRYAMISLSFNDPEKNIDQDLTIFRSKSELMQVERRVVESP